MSLRPENIRGCVFKKKIKRTKIRGSVLFSLFICSYVVCSWIVVLKYQHHNEVNKEAEPFRGAERRRDDGQTMTRHSNTVAIIDIQTN